MARSRFPILRLILLVVLLLPTSALAADESQSASAEQQLDDALETKDPDPTGTSGAVDENTEEMLTHIKEIRDQIRTALATLNPRTAEVFILRYFQGHGNHEIAKMLGTSRSTIAVMLHRARHKLREEIKLLTGEEL